MTDNEKLAYIDWFLSRCPSEDDEGFHHCRFDPGHEGDHECLSSKCTHTWTD
jgi:hypothetical protein